MLRLVLFELSSSLSISDFPVELLCQAGREQHRRGQVVAKHIRSLDRYPIDSSRSATPFSFEVATDASAIGHFVNIVNGEKRGRRAQLGEN